jgi:hypothetical protein
MEASQELIVEMKKISADSGKEYTDEEAREAAGNLMGYADLLWDIAIKETQRKNRLKKEPDGFPVEDGYSCAVCGNSINEQTGWYNWYGPTCFICRKAIIEGIIPTYVCTDRDSYYSMWHLKDRFDIKHQTAKKYIREGKLKARMVLNDTGSVHEYIFLKKENPELTKCDRERKSPARKSYDKNREKINRKWSREKTKEWKAEFKQKYKRK